MEMEEWLRVGLYQVQELLKCDPEYQKILVELEQAEVKYRNVSNKLTKQEQECIEDYIALCEELEYQRTHTAYRCGRMKRT